jgi:cytochrome c556
MFRTVLAVGAIVIGISAVAAQSDPIKQRNGLMHSMWKDGFAGPYRMANGKQPFDQAKAEAGLAKMSEIAAQLPPLWPPDSKAVPPLPRYSSSSKIWDNKPDFEAKLATMTKAVADSRGKAKDLDSLKKIVGDINKTCDNCHESYQVSTK